MCVFSGTSRNCLSEANVWLVVVLTTVVCVVPSLALRFLRVDLSPTTTDKVGVTVTLIMLILFILQNNVMQQVRHMQLSTKKETPKKQIPKPVLRTISLRSAYAFSHQRGYGELITSGKNMRLSSVSSVRSPHPTPRSSLNWITNILKEKNKVACVSGENLTTDREHDAKTVDP